MATSRPPDIVDAVRDTVVFKHNPDPPRNRPGRSQTAAYVLVHTRILPHCSSATELLLPALSRAHPSAGPILKTQAMPPASKRLAQARRAPGMPMLSTALTTQASGSVRFHPPLSYHLILIPFLVFHHDGPFDACAPSRNRQPTTAPIHAWSPSPEDNLTYGAGAYPGAHAYGAFSNDYPEPPKKKVDAIAEAWGMHEPEPFEEFQAGGGRGDTPSSSIYNGRSGRRTKDGRDAKEVYKEYLDDSALRPRISTRRTVPPPQPIFVPDPVGIPDDIQGGTPKRSRSLMQRIRKMRDAPNVPVGPDNHSSPSSPVEATRPTHRSQNSFLGRFGNKTSPSANAGFEKPEPYVFIDTHNNKELPATPNRDAAFDAPVMTYSQSSGPSGSGLGRKTSLMQKVGRVVRGR